MRSSLGRLVVAALYPFRHALERNMMLAMAVAASAPVAAMVSMFAAKFRRDVDVAVSVVTGTTRVAHYRKPVKKIDTVLRRGISF